MDLIEQSFRWLIVATALILTCFLAFCSRLFSVFRFEPIIHEFDPWFNFRASLFLDENQFYNFRNWFDEKSWFPLGRNIGATIFPGFFSRFDKEKEIVFRFDRRFARHEQHPCANSSFDQRSDRSSNHLRFSLADFQLFHRFGDFSIEQRNFFYFGRTFGRRFHRFGAGLFVTQRRRIFW